MLQLRIQYRIQVFCGSEAQEGVAKGIMTKSENVSIVIFDAGSENIVIIQKGSENIAIVRTENVIIGKRNVVIVETENITIEIGNAVIKEESIETKENALK